MAKKQTFVPPFLEVTLRADGKTLVRVERQDPTLITAEKFTADLMVAPDARRLACAITLIETALALIGNECPAAAHRLQHAVARLVIQDTPWGQMIEGEDFPF
jgi:hypothetical protein